MRSGTSDQTIIPNEEGDESSMVSNPSLQASLQRTSSSIASENYIAIGDDLSTGMESSLRLASSKNSEITEVEDDLSPGMEPSLQTTSSMLDPLEDKQSSRIGSTSSPKTKDNPFIKDLSRASYDKDAIEEHFSKLNQELQDGLQKEAVYAFLEHHNMMEAEEKVQELFYLFEAMEFMTSEWKTLMPKTNLNPPHFKANYARSDIYCGLFNHALNYANKLQDSDLNPSDSMIVSNMFEYFEAIDFMIFLINKVQEDGDIYPSFVLQKAKTSVSTFVQRFEEETISTFICLVINDEDGEAEHLFERLFKHTKPSDIINRGQVYNYALEKVQELHKVHTFLSSPSLSQRYKDVVQSNNRLNWNIAAEYDYQVKVRRFLVDLYLRDVDLKQEIGWKFIEQHDYRYLIHCVWECHKRMMVPNDVTKYKWTPLQLNYVITSSATITFGGIDIIKHLLGVWPALVNASYKGVATLHAAAWKGNEEVIKYLFTQKELDINVHTGRLVTEDYVKRFLKDQKELLDVTTFNDGILKYKNESLSFAPVLKDHEELIKSLLQQEIQVNEDGHLNVSDFLKRNLSSGKKWNTNRWNMPTYQTALHIATTRRDFKVVKLLCDVPKPHQQRLRCHEEDEEDHTPLDILYGRQNEEAKYFYFLEIEKTLLSKLDVQQGIDKLYRNRQVLVDAVNTILVGAALIAGVTFAGWLQPPLGYAQYYDLAVPYPAPSGTYDSYLAVQGNLGVKVFALFNSLSFFFAIATVIVGADAAFPTPRYQYIGHVVKTMHLLLQRAIRFLIISLVCVLGAFGSAAIVVLPPSLFFRKDLVLSIIIGGSICGYALWQLLSRHSKRVRRLNAYIRDIIKFTNVF